MLWTNQRYLERININGEYRLKLLKPEIYNPINKPETLEYCTQYIGIRTYEFLKDGHNIKDNIRECQPLDASKIMIPVSGSTEDTFNLIIRRSEKNIGNIEKVTYVQDIENYVLEFMHGYTTSGQINFNYMEAKGSSDQFKGTLVDHSGNIIKIFSSPPDRSTPDAANLARDRMTFYMLVDLHSMVPVVLMT